MRDPSLLWKISFAAAFLSFMFLPPLVKQWRSPYLVDHPGAFWLVPVGLLNGVIIGRGEWLELGLSIFNFAATAVLVFKTIKRLSK